jgi:acyl-CoA reductase-like NAD-dependent aldehyde dehydrogenase
MVMSATAESTAATSRARIDESVSVLREHATEFARLSVREKARLLRECIARMVDAAPSWVAAGSHAKGLSAREQGEEWLAGPVITVRIGRLMAESLEQIAVKGRPPLGMGGGMGEDGRYRIKVFPTSSLDRVVFPGFTAYALMEEGVDREVARRKQAAFYQRRDPEGTVSLVLGAGNVASIPPTDTFTKMFVDGSVVLLKMNPVNEWVGPILERSLDPLIARGYLRIIYGGVDEGKYVVEHEGIDDVHITGSNRTHDLIVWGAPGPERDRRMADNDPLLQKPITSELGNVSPVAIVPYDYSDTELWFEAQNLVTMVVNNASFNCNAAKIVITSRQWSQREKFFDMVARAMSMAPLRKAYYPGAFDRYRNLVGEREGVQKFGKPLDDELAWTFIRNVDADAADEPLFQVEPFCGILSETTVGSADPVEFLDSATRFMNDRLWGTLNAAIIIHPKTEADATVNRALQRAVVELRYGTVAINHWPALGYGLGSPPWGGHQSANLKDIQSGLGWVHNTYMLDGIDKAVVRGPLLVRPKPVWFYDNYKSAAIGERLIRLEQSPSWWKVPGVFAKALF